jgi:triacylglycerol esterase/lipase EstA (alpha/beta hydrolase family)
MILVLVHGWGVTGTHTYGGLAARLQADSLAGRIPASTLHHVYLGKYVSFSDEVRLQDLSRAFEAAVQRELAGYIRRGERLAVIAHSTGGPLIRDWWYRYYRSQGRPCPMSHLIMLAPANFGSALAQLGKSRVMQLKSSLLDGVEPGVGVLDWLELGSGESWALNREWVCDAADPVTAADPVYQFVLTGQSIDRKLYDHANSYTGELGSDGVVRAAAANLNAHYVKLVQADSGARARRADSSLSLEIDTMASAPATAFALLRGRAHSGERKGILRSIGNDSRRHPTHRAIQRCLGVGSARQYQRLREAFTRENATLRAAERFETSGRVVRHEYIHDAHCLVLARVRDEAGYVPESYDFKFTGHADGPDHLPAGMIVDRQRNRRDHGTLSWYLNADVALGTGRVSDRQGRTVRRPLPGLRALGLQLLPRPRERFVGHLRAHLAASAAHLATLVRRDETVLLDIELKRVVRRGTFELTSDQTPASFKRQRPGNPVA